MSNQFLDLTGFQTLVDNLPVVKDKIYANDVAGAIDWSSWSEYSHYIHYIDDNPTPLNYLINIKTDSKKNLIIGTGWGRSGFKTPEYNLIGGTRNRLGHNTTESIVGGGKNRLFRARDALMSGYKNFLYVTENSSISAGYANQIKYDTNSAIFAGRDNLIQGYITEYDSDGDPKFSSQINGIAGDSIKMYDCKGCFGTGVNHVLNGIFYGVVGGLWNELTNNYETAFGKYSKSNAGQLFAIGNGYRSFDPWSQPVYHRSNAFEVYENGDAKIAGDFYIKDFKISVTPATSSENTQVDFSDGTINGRTINVEQVNANKVTIGAAELTPLSDFRSPKAGQNGFMLNDKASITVESYLALSPESEKTEITYEAIQNGNEETIGYKILTAYATKYLYIPDKIDDLPVIEIADGACENCIMIETADLPFMGRTPDLNYQQVIFGSIFGAETIDEQAFLVPQSLRKVIIRDISNKPYRANMFKGCKFIKKFEFQSMYALNNALPSWAEEIVLHKFNRQDDNKFAQNYRGKGISIYKHGVYMATDDSPYAVLLTTDFEDKSVPTEFEIHPNCRMLGSNCLQGLSSITRIDVPDKVTYICEGAFRNCSSLQECYLGRKVNYVSYETFAGCNSLITFEVGPALTTMYSAFKNCNSPNLTIDLRRCTRHNVTEGRVSIPSTKDLAVEGRVIWVDDIAEYETNANWSELITNNYVEEEPEDFSDNTKSTYYIRSSKDIWKFADQISYHYRNFANKIIKLCSDVVLNQPIGYTGSSNDCCPFSGSFDGQGYTVTLNQNINNPDGEGGLFSFVRVPEDSTCYIKNVHVDGTINLTNNKTGCGFVGGVVSTVDAGFGGSGGELTLKNIWSSVEINGRNSNAWNYISGFLGFTRHELGLKPLTIEIDSCVWDGVINCGSAMYDCGGFIGGTGSNNQGRTLNIYIIKSISCGTFQSNSDWSQRFGGFVGYGKGSSSSDASAKLTINCLNLLSFNKATYSKDTGAKSLIGLISKIDGDTTELSLSDLYYVPFLRKGMEGDFPVLASGEIKSSINVVNKDNQDNLKKIQPNGFTNIGLTADGERHMPYPTTFIETFGIYDIPNFGTDKSKEAVIVQNLNTPRDEIIALEEDINELFD